MLLKVKGLKKYFLVRQGFFRRTVGYYKALDGVDFTIGSGETFGLVGESGCGKTTVAKTITRLLEPTSGEVLLDGRDICCMGQKELLAERKNIQIVFQDPYGSLHPRMTVADLIAEPLLKHRIVSKGPACIKKIQELLSIVGLCAQDMRKYPHEFSGGQRQRIVIARALAVQPKLIVCDEPVSALDVSIQAQILNLMKDLQDELHVAYLFIAHGMPVIRHISDKVGVMYLGKIVEIAPCGELFSHCSHPYTKALMSAVPVANPDAKQQRIILEGEVPSLVNKPDGCLFSTRCNHCTEICRKEQPMLKEIAPGHMVACHKFGLKEDKQEA